jgi:hypothetical protein
MNAEEARAQIKERVVSGGSLGHAIVLTSSHYGDTVVGVVSGRAEAERAMEARAKQHPRERYEIVDLTPKPRKRFSIEIEGTDRDDAERKLRDALRAGPTTLELREV